MSVKVTFLESTEIGGQRPRQLGDSFLFDITEDDKIGTFNILFCRIVAEERLTEALSSRAVLYFTVENSKEANNILKAIALASDSWIGCDKCLPSQEMQGCALRAREELCYCLAIV